MSSDQQTSQSIPSEYRISKKWDDALENGIINVSTGVVVAGLASIVLFRGRQSRVAFTALGAGFGAGMTYQKAATEFEKEKGGQGN